MSSGRSKSAIGRRCVLGLLAAAAAGVSATVPSAGPVAAARLLLSPMPNLKPAPDFALADLDDKVHRLADYRGRVVLVNFWATWCPPCRFEIPAMQRAWEILRDEDIAVLAPHVGGDADQVFRFTADFDIDFPLLIDGGSEVTDAWPVLGQPTTIVVDPEGRMALRAVGSREWDEPAILDQIRALKNA